MHLSLRSIPKWPVLLLTFAGILIFQGLPGLKPLDDSFITYRYARSIAEGNGFVYNPGERVQGTTTPLYTLLLALLTLPMGSEWMPEISFAIALAADTVNVWLVYLLAKRIFSHPWIAALCSIVFLLQPLRLNVAAGGMETSLFITFLLVMYLSHFSGRAPYQVGVWAALTILTRLDGVLAVAPLLVHAFLKNRRGALLTGATTGVLCLPWMLWATLYFGSPIPHSILAKSLAYQDTNPNDSLFFLMTFLGTGTVGPYEQILILLPGLIIALFLIITGLHWFLKEQPIGLVIAGYPLVYYGVMTAISAPLFFSWYYLPLMPGFLFLFAGSLSRLAQFSAGWQKKGVFALAAIGLLLFPASLMRVSPGWADDRSFERVYQRACQAIRAEVHPGQVILAPDIGVLGWCLDEAHILDPIGLVSPRSLPYLHLRPAGELVSLQLVLDLTPDYIISRELFIKNILSDARIQRDYQIIWEEPVATDRALILKLLE